MPTDTGAQMMMTRADVMVCSTTIDCSGSTCVNAAVAIDKMRYSVMPAGITPRDAAFDLPFGLDTVGGCDDEWACFGRRSREAVGLVFHWRLLLSGSTPVSNESAGQSKY